MIDYQQHLEKTNKIKVIFLDFDGVITTEKSRYNLDADAVSLLTKIIDATDAKIVISSSWRFNSLDMTIEDLKIINERKPFVFPHLDRIVGVTSRMFGFKIHEQDRHYKLFRGVEIDRYLNDHSNIENYVILDDDSDMLLWQVDKFVHTDSKIGLTEEDVKRAIKILNK